MKTFARLSVFVLGLAAALQWVRVAAGWPVAINGADVPSWASAVVGTVAGLLAVLLWRESRRG